MRKKSSRLAPRGSPKPPGIWRSFSSAMRCHSSPRTPSLGPRKSGMGPRSSPWKASHRAPVVRWARCRVGLILVPERDWM